MYSLVFDEKAIAFLEKLPKEIAQRIYKKINTTKKEPFHYFERLEGREDYKLRVGDYRVIGNILQSEKKIEIILIGHRKNIYKKI